MGRKKAKLVVVGKTEDGRSVISGVFKMYDTLGMPLADVIDTIHQKNFVISWIHFYEEAKKGGWKYDTIMTRLREGIIDTHGLEYFNVVEKKLNEWISYTSTSISQPSDQEPKQEPSKE